mgnify:CR=1 FL=1
MSIVSGIYSIYVRFFKLPATVTVRFLGTFLNTMNLTHFAFRMIQTTVMEHSTCANQLYICQACMFSSYPSDHTECAYNITYFIQLGIIDMTNNSVAIVRLIRPYR